ARRIVTGGKIMVISAKASRARLAVALVALPAVASAQTDKDVARQANKVAAEANQLTSETAKLNNVVANATDDQNNNAANATGNGYNDGDNDGANDGHRGRGDDADLGREPRIGRRRAR